MDEGECEEGRGKKKKEKGGGAEEEKQTRLDISVSLHWNTPYLSFSHSTRKCSSLRPSHAVGRLRGAVEVSNHLSISTATP